MDDANIFVAGLFTRGDRHREDFYILSLSPNFIENTASEATAWPFVGAGLLPLHHELVKKKKRKGGVIHKPFQLLAALYYKKYNKQQYNKETVWCIIHSLLLLTNKVLTLFRLAICLVKNYISQAPLRVEWPCDTV